MRFDIITLFPHMFADFPEWGVTGRAVTQGRVSLHTWNPRDYTHDRHARVDDRPYGGGPGMVMRYQPLADALTAVQASDARPGKVICLSPQGVLFSHQQAKLFATEERLVFLAGRYEGIDERVIEHCVDIELSIGDYVLSGGELATLVVMDAITRLLPGILGNDASAQQDSFGQGLLDCPHYTRPAIVNGMHAPDVLLGGNHQAIARWRLKQALGRTWLRRPELLKTLALSTQQATLLEEFKVEFLTEKTSQE